MLVWRLTRTPPPKHPEISAYTHGQLVRVGPYRYCDVFNLTDCEIPKTVGELTVNVTRPGATVGAAGDLEGAVGAAAGLRG